MTIGYPRVSTNDQKLDAQTDALTAAESGKLFADKIGGSKRELKKDREIENTREVDRGIGHSL